MIFCWVGSVAGSRSEHGQRRGFGGFFLVLFRLDRLLTDGLLLLRHRRRVGRLHPSHVFGQTSPTEKNH